MEMPKQGQQRGTPSRRAEFMESLRELGDGTECVYWPWSDIRGQYVSVHVDGRFVRVHRWIYEQIHEVELPRGSIGPGDHVVMHTCDNRACIRPSHLVLGTQLENMQDAVSKGRHRPRVGDGYRTKLTVEQVADIRRLAAEDIRFTVLARVYLVSPATISDIVNRRTRIGGQHQKLSDADVVEIRRLAAEPGARQTHIAKVFHVSDSTISVIVNGRKRVIAAE
jgi:plasmid maintenance system antidote protein VapI